MKAFLGIMIKLTYRKNICYEPAHEILVLVASADSQGLDEPLHVLSLVISPSARILKKRTYMETRSKLEVSNFTRYLRMLNE